MQPDDKKPNNPPKPGSLEAKFKLLLRLSLNERTRRKHVAVFGFILDWWHEKYGNALASLRHIEGELHQRAASVDGGKGLGRTHISAALADLKEWGYLIQLPGGKRGAGRYVPNWDLVCTVHNAGDSEGTETTVHTVGDTVSTPQGTDEASSVHNGGNKDPSTLPGLQNRVRVSGNIGPHGSAAPALEGPDAAPRVEGEENEQVQNIALEPIDPFTLFWAAYPRKYQKPKARTAWGKLDPSPALAERIVTAAKTWAEHYAANPVDKKWIPTPANWLDGERYDEDLPEVYGEPKPKKAKGQRTELGKNISEVAPPTPANDNQPIRRAVVAVKGGVMPDGRGAKYIRLYIVDAEIANREDPQGEWLTICAESPEYGEQEQGQKELNSLITALGLDSLDDPDHLLHRVFDFVGHEDGTYNFHPAPYSAKETA